MKRFPNPLIPVAAAAMLSAVAACAGSTANDHTGSANLNGTPVLSTTLSLAAGASADVASANLRIRFDSVSSESRCPTSVQCVHAGSASVRLTIAQLSGTMTAQLLTLSTMAGQDTATSYGQRIRLLQVLPAPTTTAPIPQSSYRIELKVGSDK